MSERAPTPTRRGIDPRGPRFAAGITAGLLLLTVLLGLAGLSCARTPTGWAITQASLLERASDPAFLLLLAITALFAWGLAAPRTAPWGVVYRSLVAPRLAPPAELEDPRPPRFAQGVGLFVSGSGVLLHLAGVPWALTLAAGAAFVAAVLNAAIGLCLGCELYLLLQRAGFVGRTRRLRA